MRKLYQAAAVAAVIVFALGVKAIVPTPVADAAVNPGLNVLQMQTNAPSLPAQYIRDMTFALE